MSLDCFRKAVRSVADWPGVIGLFGGNPCVHPKFPELCEILCEEIPEQRRRGLWSNNLMDHGEAVKKTFYPHGRFNMNAHMDAAAAKEIERWLPGKLIRNSASQPSWHSAILLNWRDMGLSVSEWIRLRERCDINLKWSACIREHEGEPVAYFCEVAAAIDGIMGNNHGIPATPGWWHRKMSAFSSQVSCCCDIGCGVPLRGLGHMDRDDTYDMTPSWRARLQCDSFDPKVKIETHGLEPLAKCVEATDYMRLRT